MSIRPCTLKAANAFVSGFHRHSDPVQGCKWAVALWLGDRLCGVAICGRPVARHLDDGLTCEVTRVCTDGAPGGCSALYGASRRIAVSMGYRVGVTYTLDSEGGASLRAMRAMAVKLVKGEQADRPSRPRKLRAETPARKLWALWGQHYLNQTWRAES